MAEQGLRPIIVKRIKKGGDPHLGGSWKIAYADFVTAMMGFFLLMWLLGANAKNDLQGISDYFKTPLKVVMAAGSGSAESSSVLPGGGRDLTQQDGQLKKSFHLRSAAAELEKSEQARLKELKKRIETAIDNSSTLKKYKDQFLLDITTEGLRIQIVDEKNRAMFALAKADLQPYTKDILHEIGEMLNDVPNKISLFGHTDATPYTSGEKSYSNWELSSDRANASRRELITGGMDESKVLRVVGLSSVVLLDKEDPFNPINRRISIIVMNKKAEDALEKDSGSLAVSNDADLKEGIALGAGVIGTVRPVAPEAKN